MKKRNLGALSQSLRQILSLRQNAKGSKLYPALAIRCEGREKGKHGGKAILPSPTTFSPGVYFPTRGKRKGKTYALPKPSKKKRYLEKFVQVDRPVTPGKAGVRIKDRLFGGRLATQKELVRPEGWYFLIRTDIPPNRFCLKEWG